MVRIAFCEQSAKRHFRNAVCGWVGPEVSLFTVGRLSTETPRRGVAGRTWSDKKMNKVKDTYRESDAKVPLLTVGSPSDKVPFIYFVF